MAAEGNVIILQFSNIIGKLKSFNGKSTFKCCINQCHTRPKLENWNENNKIYIKVYLH